MNKIAVALLVCLVPATWSRAAGGHVVAFARQDGALIGPALVGRSSTGKLADYPAEALVPYQPNKRSQALRIRPERRDILAPPTCILTIVYQRKPPDDEGRQVVIVHSLYPGPDIGQLRGDITAREGVVFFYWEHPGQPRNKSSPEDTG